MRADFITIQFILWCLTIELYIMCSIDQYNCLHLMFFFLVLETCNLVEVNKWSLLV